MTEQDAAFLTDLGLRIRVLRIACRMSQDQLAATANLSRVTLGSVERGEHAAGILTYRALAAALGIPLSRLFDDDSHLGYLTGLGRPGKSR
jgi:DNA-binding XRE family transcriptional regulator